MTENALVFLSYAENSAPADCASGTVVGTAEVTSGTSFQVTGLKADTAYGFRVCYKDADNGLISSGVTSTTSTHAPTPPPAPTLTGISPSKGSTDGNTFVTKAEAILDRSRI